MQAKSTFVGLLAVSLISQPILAANVKDYIATAGKTANQDLQRESQASQIEAHQMMTKAQVLYHQALVSKNAGVARSQLAEAMTFAKLSYLYLLNDALEEGHSFKGSKLKSDSTVTVALGADVLVAYTLYQTIYSTFVEMPTDAINNLLKKRGLNRDPKLARLQAEQSAQKQLLTKETPAPNAQTVAQETKSGEKEISQIGRTAEKIAARENSLTSEGFLRSALLLAPRVLGKTLRFVGGPLVVNGIVIGIAGVTTQGGIGVVLSNQNYSALKTRVDQEMNSAEENLVAYNLANGQ